ncbi:hypothetical protein [Companilactobacillus sp. HBUAS59544]|uniref:hypothetical protein n=1 Tax=Companilactobacillus sp. HBUAS59544 TaxID=3109363 RepID=UPI002FEF15B2
MKTKVLLLSSLILGGFSAPLVQPTTALAVETNQSSKIDSQEIKLNEKVDLNSLPKTLNLSIEAYSSANELLENVTLTLDASEMSKLKNDHKVSVTLPDIETKSNWGGNLEYAPKAESSEIVYDEASQSLVLISDNQKITHPIYKLIDGTAKIHYVTEDTKKELFVHEQEHAFKPDAEGKNEFVITPLEEIYEAPYPIGYFDAYELDFEGLAHYIPLNDNTTEVDLDEPLIQKYNETDINKNSEFTIYLKKAKPYTINFKVYLDNKEYVSRTIKGELNGTIPFQEEPKLPDPTVATLNKYKTAYSSTSEYLPQLGTGIQTGAALFYRIFERNFDNIGDGSTKNMLNTGIYGITGEELEENEVPVNSMYTGRTSTIELYYESINQNDTNNNDSNSNEKPNPDENSNQKPDTDNGNQSVDKPGNSNLPNNKPTKFNGYVGTMKNTVSVYSLKDGQMTVEKNKKLAKHSDWRSDRIIIIDGEKYYRVATEEWVKADDIYRYEPTNGIVETMNSEITHLVNSDMKQVTNRGLAANTAWKYDRIAYLGANETKHFRVASHEFVSASDVSVK